MKDTPTGLKPAPARPLWRRALRALLYPFAYAYAACAGLASLFAIDVWPVVRRFPKWWWITVALVVAWYICDPILTGQHWRYLTMILTPAIIIAVTIKWDPPPPPGRFWHTFSRYILLKMGVPILGLTTLLEYNWEWNVRLIGGGIAAVWLLGVVLRARHQRKMAWIIASLEYEHELFRRAIGLPATPDEIFTNHIFTPMDGYGQWLANQYGTPPQQKDTES